MSAAYQGAVHSRLLDRPELAHGDVNSALVLKRVLNHREAYARCLRKNLQASLVQELVRRAVKTIRDKIGDGAAQIP